MDVRVLTDEQPGFSEHQSDLLFQALRELLTNVVKHAGVSSAVVTVNKQDRDTWLIAVQDSGAGFDLNAVQYLPSGEHFGLFSIQERMEAMSGWCRIHSRPGEGTTVELGLAAIPPDASRTPHVSGTAVGVADPPRAAVPSRWRVLLVDDHAMVRQGLRSILETYSDLEIIGKQPMALRRWNLRSAHSLTWSSWTSTFRNSMGSRRPRGSRIMRRMLW